MGSREADMPTDKDIAWFKGEFGAAIAGAVKGTPFTIDMLTAIACQETGEIWPILRAKGLPTGRIVELCVGDTLDSNKGRSAFPKDKAELLAHPKGAAMFKVGNEALKEMAKFINGYSGAAGNPNKFCHGYGVFQYDIQFFKVDPDYFLDRSWAKFEGTLGKAISELDEALGKVGLAGRASLTDMEMAKVAIAYNKGSFDPARGLKQGHKNDDGTFYGENFFNFLTRAHKIAAAPAGPGAVLPAGAGVGAGGHGSNFTVATAGGLLMLRSAPRPDPANIVAKLPNGQKVIALGAEGPEGFIDVSTTLAGKSLRGFASARFLKAA
jgi:hypothetical protein